jgi:hypothetical protein
MEGGIRRRRMGMGRKDDGEGDRGGRAGKGGRIVSEGWCPHKLKFWRLHCRPAREIDGRQIDSHNENDALT